MRRHRDLFVDVPAFLAAFDDIAANGFFEKIEFHVGGERSEGKIPHCSISAIGYVPNAKKYAAKGCGAIIDPHSVVAQCRRLSRTHEVSIISATVETNEWTLWDASENNIIGSKGKRTKLYLSIQFKV